MNTKEHNASLLMKETTAALSDRWDSFHLILKRLPTFKKHKNLRVRLRGKSGKQKVSAQKQSVSSFNESVNRYSRKILNLTLS